MFHEFLCSDFEAELAINNPENIGVSIRSFNGKDPGFYFPASYIGGTEDRVHGGVWWKGPLNKSGGKYPEVWFAFKVCPEPAKDKKTKIQNQKVHYEKVIKIFEGLTSIVPKEWDRKFAPQKLAELKGLNGIDSPNKKSVNTLFSLKRKMEKITISEFNKHVKTLLKLISEYKAIES